jgi:hypothetical protein
VLVLAGLSRSLEFQALAIPNRLVIPTFVRPGGAGTAGRSRDAGEIDAELRVIPERRVRLGAVMAELARRWDLGGEAMEDKVVSRILESARITERPATEEELREL